MSWGWGKEEVEEETGDMEGVESIETEDNETISETRRPEFHSLFEHNCSYKNINENETEGCAMIQLTPNYNVEVMIPVYSKAINQTLYVPFLIRSAQKDTTFSRKTLSTFQVDNDRDNLTLIEDDYPAIPGEDNILGLSFLDQSLLAIDFYSYEAGMSVNLKSGGIFSVNWPLDSFKDNQLESRAADITQKHRRLKKQMKKLQTRSATKLSDLRKLAIKKDKTIAALQQRLVEVQMNSTNQTEENAVLPGTNNTNETYGTPGKIGTTAPDTEPESELESETDLGPESEEEPTEEQEQEEDEEYEEQVKRKGKKKGKRAGSKKRKMKIDL